MVIRNQCGRGLRYGSIRVCLLIAGLWGYAGIHVFLGMRAYVLARGGTVSDGPFYVGTGVIGCSAAAGLLCGLCAARRWSSRTSVAVGIVTGLVAVGIGYALIGGAISLP